jgi:hypothetical protein
VITAREWISTALGESTLLQDSMKREEEDVHHRKYSAGVEHIAEVVVLDIASSQPVQSEPKEKTHHGARSYLLWYA